MKGGDEKGEIMSSYFNLKLFERNSLPLLPNPLVAFCAKYLTKATWGVKCCFGSKFGGTVHSVGAAHTAPAIMKPREMHDGTWLLFPFSVSSAHGKVSPTLGWTGHSSPLVVLSRNGLTDIPQLCLTADLNSVKVTIIASNHARYCLPSFHLSKKSKEPCEHFGVW